MLIRMTLSDTYFNETDPTTVVIHTVSTVHARHCFFLQNHSIISTLDRSVCHSQGLSINPLPPKDRNLRILSEPLLITLSKMFRISPANLQGDVLTVLLGTTIDSGSK